MLHDVTDDELQAVIMFDAIKFHDLWEAGTALLRDEEDSYGAKEQMFSHAARFLALWGVVKNYKRLGWLRRVTTKRFASQIEKALIECGAMTETVRESVEILSNLAEDKFEAERLRRLARGIIRLSPTLNPRQVTLIDEYLALSRGI
ncbi:hypothetical protein [Parvibaculum sp.]|uniref:hypothetical protein n=1 Tax=Parvibaculum sp. TaxID=2024848 RepID=UPI003BA88B06